MHSKSNLFSKRFQQYFLLSFLITFIIVISITLMRDRKKEFDPAFELVLSEKFLFNSFVDCNMAEAWIGDTFRIFPGKYGEDPLWGYARDLKFANGRNADETFLRKREEFTEPALPPNVTPEQKGLHGAAWFETIYQDPKDKTGKTLYAIYHNENYPSTLPYDSLTGEGYKNSINWPRGLTGDTTPAAVCRIGIMKSLDGGHSWENKGIFIEDLNPRMILKPNNTSVTFAGGVGDPSAIANGDWLYLFYGEYGYPGDYAVNNYDPAKEWQGQCVSIARIRLDDLDNPVGKAKRWNGKEFAANYNAVGNPVKSLQVGQKDGGGPTSSPNSKYHWGPSVSWNEHLNCWVMLMARSEGPSWKGGTIYISFNKNKDLGQGTNSQEWTKPKLLLSKPGHTLWYPSLQPMNTVEDIKRKRTCLKLGREARLFFKDMHGDTSEYISEYKILFSR